MLVIFFNLEQQLLNLLNIIYLINDGDIDPARAKGLIRYFDIIFMMEPLVQICASICLRKLQKGYSYMLGPCAVEDSCTAR